MSFFLNLRALTAAPAGAFGLSDLDLTHVQNATGPIAETEQPRTDNGVVLGVGASLWVDLKNDATAFKATVAPFVGSRGAPVRCRIATANDIVDVIVSEGSSPREISLPLTNHKLLIVEVHPTSPAPDSLRIHLSPSSIVSNEVLPASWGGAAPIEWNTPEWRLKIDGRSGGITRLAHPGDAFDMNWIRPASLWGSGFARLRGQTVAWDRPESVEAVSPHEARTVYRSGDLRIEVSRKLDENGRIRESYTFENTGKEKLSFEAGDLGILVPFFDTYPNAELCQTQRCHAHIWTGGSTAYVNALRMGGAAPHLGLVLTEGKLVDYSIHNRVGHSNDRGQFLLHPEKISLGRGEKHTLSWMLFWHRGWEDFYDQASEYPSFLRLEAEHYTLAPDEPLRLKLPPQHTTRTARVWVDGTEMKPLGTLGQRRIEVPLVGSGEHTVEVRVGERTSLLRAFVSPGAMDLIKARVEFIVERQQRRADGDRLDGAYLIYDNEKETQIYDSSFPDHNAGRERLAMGTLVALYLPHCDDPGLKERLTDSLRRYDAFVSRELQNPRGVVFNDAGRDSHRRMYNYPWVAHYHLAMHRAFGHVTHLRKAVETVRSYYAQGGERFYCIGMPVKEMIEALRRSGWKNDEHEILAAFRRHADRVLQNGAAFPAHEVNYEQSIVGPAAQLLLEFYLVTRERAYLSGAVQQLKLLELFNGPQPDYRLNEIAIRHWDGYWFGGRKQYGDTFPHYWSTITGVVFGWYAKATGDQSYWAKAENNLRNNFCLFTPEGRGSAAYMFPLRVNEKPGRYLDPWANDQDWALVNWLTIFPPK